MTNPAFYVVWAVLVLVALTSSYLGDPYVFAFTTLGLAWLSAGVSVTGVAVAVLSRTTSWHAKASIVFCVAVTAIAVAAALQILKTFRWA